MLLNLTDITQPKNLESLLDKLTNYGIELGKDIIAAIVIYIIGRFIIRQLKKFIATLLQRRRLEPSVCSFIESLVGILLNLVLVFAVISQLGINTTSFAAILASAGVAIGMALSGNLSNFAGGLIILIFKPFKVGDYIETALVSGTVTEIQIFHTILTTPDNRVIYAPNGTMSSNAIINYSIQKSRRAEWIFNVKYGQDFEIAKETIMEILTQDNYILTTPEPTIAINALSASSVDIMVRAWTPTEAYWDTYWDINKKVYDTFNRKGIEFPFPQLTIHKA